MITCDEIPNSLVEKVKRALWLAVVVPLLMVFSFGCQNTSNKAATATEPSTIFPLGQQGAAEYFTGKAYNFGLVASDSTYNMLVGNVYFEAGARSNWHSHPSGQVLIITEGVGYHQIEGQAIQIMKKGEVVKCPPNVRHWHGASPDSDLHQLYIIPNTENGIVNWMEAVTDAQYFNQR